MTKLPLASDPNEASAHNLVASCEQYLDQNQLSPPVLDEEDSAEVVMINPFADVHMFPSGSDFIQHHQHERKLSTISDIRDSIQMTHHDHQPEDISYYKTLPRTSGRRKGLQVPKRVRQILDRAKSCEPELPQIRFRIHTLEDNDVQEDDLDGTESVSSFVALSPGQPIGNKSSSTLGGGTSGEEWSDSGEYNYYDNNDPPVKLNASADDPDGSNKKGFVNKCVTRVKSFVGNNKNN